MRQLEITEHVSDKSDVVERVEVRVMRGVVWTRKMKQCLKARAAEAIECCDAVSRKHHSNARINKLEASKEKTY